MSNSNVFISFSLFLFFIISFASSSSSFNASTTHKCSPQQTLDLLLFKQNLYSDEGYVDIYCREWLGSDYYPMNWNKNTDCCKWAGVTCDRSTGDAIGIDLSCGMLRGTIHPNSSLFQLSHLKTLNLAYNKLTSFQFPRDFSSSLTHLNISNCEFSGEISWEISLLPKLVSLDLSENNGLQMQPNVLKNLLQNSSHLRELFIYEVQVGWVLPTYLNTSSSLRSLSLGNTGLQGKLPDNLFNLQCLETLDLSNNNQLNGPLPKVNTSLNIPLMYLNLYGCSLVGPLPKSLVNLRCLTSLDIASNYLNGTLPSFLFTLPLLEDIHLSNNMFSGVLPLELFNCRSLKTLILFNNQFDGEINGGSTQPSFTYLVNLTRLNLSSNNFTGIWELETLFSSLPNLQLLDLSYSGLFVITKNSSSIYINPNFWFLGLASCKLGIFPESLRAMKNLSSLDISNNDIHGCIPDWAGEVNMLYRLNISHNSITCFNSMDQI